MPVIAEIPIVPFCPSTSTFPSLAGFDVSFATVSLKAVPVLCIPIFSVPAPLCFTSKIPVWVKVELLLNIPKLFLATVIFPFVTLALFLEFLRISPIFLSVVLEAEFERVILELFTNFNLLFPVLPSSI